MGSLLTLVLLFAGFTALIFLLAWLDGRRIEAYIASIGGELIELESRRLRLRGGSSEYRVTFRDRDGVVRTLGCWTSLTGGTSLREELPEVLDMVLRKPGPARPSSPPKE